MIYRGYFADINNDQWSVELNTTPHNADNTYTDITLSRTPVTVSLEGDNNIFKPLKLSGATIRCWVSDYMFDIFTGTAKGVTCRIYKGSDLFWTGYVTPNIYNQSYGSHKFELEVECYDGLSVLNYINYTSYNKKVISLLDIIKKCLTATGCGYSDLYISDFSDKKLQDMYISEYNFFDEDGAPMKMKEVLENILNYLKLTMYQSGKGVYIVDYDRIINTYYKHNLATDVVSMVVLNNTLSLADTTVYEGSNMSLTEVYNKITVRSSLYQFDSYIPSPDDKKYLYTNNNSGEITNVQSGWTHLYNFLFSKKWEYKKYDKNYSQDNSSIFTPYAVFGSNVIKGFKYKGDRPNDPNYDYLLAFRSSVGVVPVQSMDYILGANPAVNVIGGVTKNNYTEIYNDDWADITHNPFVADVATDYNAPFCAGYLQLKFDTLFSTLDLPFPNDSISSDKDFYTVGGVEYVFSSSMQNISTPKKDCSVVCKLQIGEYYWNGSEWTKMDSNFLVQIGKKKDKLFHLWHNIADVNTVQNGVETLNGYIIPIPDDKVLIGNVKFNMATPRPVRYGKITWFYSFVRNLSLRFVKKSSEFDDVINGTLSEYEKENITTDEIWENVINNENVSEFGKVQLKVCTDTNKGVNFGAVLVYDGSDYQFLTNVKKGANNAYMEEHLIDSMYNQFHLPRKSIDVQVKRNIPLHTLIDDHFIINSAKYDIADNITDLNVMEIL